MHIQARHLLAILLCSLIFMAPAFLLGAGGSDLHCQSLWVRYFSGQFWQGDLYPRWLQDMFAGRGSPVFFYYPPLTYFITALFAFLSPLDAFGYTQIAASAFLAVLASGIAFYIWAREETNNADAALLGALLYIAAPNHIAQDFYYILLLSSLWAYAWIPLLFLFAKRIARQQSYSVVGFAFSLGLLIMTNIPLTIIFGPIAVLYGIFCSTQRFASICKLAVATVLGFSISAISLFPAIAYRGFASLFWHWIEHYHWTEYPSPVVSGAYTAYLILSLLLTGVYFRKTKQMWQSQFLFWSSLVVFLLMLPISQPLWENVILLQVIQMAERFFAVFSVFLALFAAMAFPKLRNLSYALLVGYAAVTAVVAYHTRITLEEFSKRNPVRYEMYTLGIDQYPGYLPSLDVMDLYNPNKKLAETKTHDQPVETFDGDAAIEVLTWQPREIMMHYRAAKPSTLEVRQFFFPGFKAFLNDKEIDIRRDEHTKQIIFDVPAGEGMVDLKLTQLLPELIGKAVSLVAAVVLLLLLLMEMRRRDRIT
jgi:hypothetical protein